MRDAERIYNFKGDRAVVVGAGSIGVESCISLMRRGVRVTLLEQLGQVLPTVFDDEAAGMIRGAIEQMGIEVIEHEFPDHHEFSAQDLNLKPDLPILVTHKDAVKLKGLAVTKGARADIEKAGGSIED